MLGAEPMPFTIHRTKGQIFLSDGRVLMIQGVRDVFEIIDQTTPEKAQRDLASGLAQKRGKIVLIGKGIWALPFQESLGMNVY